MDIDIPDFEDFLRLAGLIKETQVKLDIAKWDLQILRAEITNKVMSDSSYWAGSNRPSNAHIRDTFHVLGYDDATKQELTRLQASIYTLSGELEFLQKAFYVSKMKVDAWRTQSANQRNAFI